MPEPYVGEIRMFAGNFAPSGWMFCEGQTLSIAENEVLFTLIGTTYGGDGVSTFNLPDLRSRVPIHMGTGSDGASYTLGQTGGVETVTLSAQQIPNHAHALMATTQLGTQNAPGNGVPASLSGGIMLYREVAPAAAMNAAAVSSAGGSQPHTNIQPYGTVNYIISLFGIFPSQT